MDQLSGREQLIYDLLQDDLSRQIFVACKRFAETGENDDLWKLADHPTGFEKTVSKLKKHKYILYGAGAVCRKIVNHLRTAGVIDNCLGIWDRNPAKSNTEIAGVRVSLPQPGLDFKYALPAVSEKFKPELFAEILSYLESIGISEERVIKPYFTILENSDEYFDDEIIKTRLQTDEVFIDGGCYDFFTSKQFIRICKERHTEIKAIHAFEPDAKLAEKCRQNSAEYPFASVHQAGLWSENKVLSFYTHTESGSLQVGGSEMNLDVVALDKYLPNDDTVTFIKFDIEGAELEALKGAAETIKRGKPKLAVCIYHNPLDYLELPEYIRSLVSDYKMYIRIYGGEGAILYCVSDDEQ